MDAVQLLCAVCAAAETNAVCERTTEKPDHLMAHRDTDKGVNACTFARARACIAAFF